MSVCVMAGWLLAVGGAQASDSSVRAAIEGSSRQVKESPELQEALKEIRDNPKTIAKLKKGISDFEGVLRKVLVTVSQQTASTSGGKAGEAAWIGGLRTLLRGLEGIKVALTDVKAGHKALAKSELKHAVALIKDGAAEAKKGKLLLGVKTV